MQVYWGVIDARDLYMLNLAERWAHEHANFTVIPVLSDTTHSPEWAGRTGLVHQALLADHPDLRGHEVYVCGSVTMVATDIPAFLAQGLDAEACHSDAFHPSAQGVGSSLGPCHASNASHEGVGGKEW